MRIIFKTTFIVVLIILGTISCQERLERIMNSNNQSQKSILTKSTEELDYYQYTTGKKVALQKMDSKFRIMFYAADEVKLKDELSKSGLKLENEEYIAEFSSYSCDLSGSYAKDLTDYKVAILNGSLKNATSTLSHTFYWAPFYKVVNPKELDGIEEIGFTNLFLVQLKSIADLPILQKMALENMIEIVGADKMPGSTWYTMACTKLSAGNSLEMANKFNESKLFKNIIPDVIGAGNIH